MAISWLPKRPKYSQFIQVSEPPPPPSRALLVLYQICFLRKKLSANLKIPQNLKMYV